MKPQKIIFLHVPKTAGTTFFQIVSKQYDENKIFYIDGMNVKKSLEHFKSLDNKTRNLYSCIYGHQPFGMHKFFNEKTYYITLLRDPIERIISHYHYVLRTPTHYLHKTVKSNKISLKEYAKSGISSELSNGQTKLISGDESNSSNQEILIKAIKNIDNHFYCVGFSDFFDETILLLKRKLGWKDVYYSKKNVAPKGSSKRIIPQSTIDEIAEANELDIKLYDYALQKFKAETSGFSPFWEKKIFAFSNNTLNFKRKISSRIKALSPFHH